MAPDRGHRLVVAGRVCYGLAVVAIFVGWAWGELWFGGGERAAFVWIYSAPVGLAVALGFVFAGRVLVGAGRDPRLRARGRGPAR